VDGELTPAIHIVTLGVADMAAMRAFYERLGLAASSASNDHVTFFQMTGCVLGLFGRRELAEDAAVPPSAPSSFKGFTLAWNAGSRAGVDAIMQHARQAGATITKPAQEVFWGGYSGYFADPEGNLWEVAHNPFFPFDEHGLLRLP
jgi:catechol 2,3-dioxygenase-like lactoylglutathione lyase family enzyme